MLIPTITRELSETLKEFYGMDSLNEIETLKETSIGKCYRLRNKGIDYFFSQSFNKNFIFENPSVLDYVYPRLQTPKIIPTISGAKVAVKNGVFSYMTEYLKIEGNEWKTNSNRYFRIMKESLDVLHSIDVSDFIEKTYVRVYKKVLMGKYLNPNFSNIYVREKLFPDLKNEIELLENFFISNKGLLNRRFENSPNLCLIYGDLNTSNIIKSNYRLYVIDLKSIQPGFAFEDIDVISMDLISDAKLFSEWISFVENIHQESFNTLLCGIIIRINSMLNVYNKYEYSLEQINKDYLPSRIKALCEIISSLPKSGT